MNKTVERAQSAALKKGKLIGWIIVIAIVVAAIIIAVVALYSKAYGSAEERYQAEIAALSAEVEELSKPAAVYEHASGEVILGIIETKMETIGELATAEYMYTDAGKFSDMKQLFGKDIPLTAKSFIAKWSGSIKAGIDIEKITYEVDDTNCVITVRLPEARILSHEVDEESFETLEEKDGLFNKLEVDDIRMFDKESKASMEQRALDGGILMKAAQNAELAIRGLLFMNPEISKDYTLKFETAK